MKQLFVAAIICCCSTFVHAQAYDSVPAYRKDSTIPAFTILQTDSTWFNKEALPHNKPLILIYFRSDCGHCQLTAHEFQQKLNQFKDVFFVWLSYDSIPNIKQFALTFQLGNQSNIRIGRDVKYFVPSFFRIKYTPFIAVYSRKGKLIQTYEGGAEPETIIQLLHL